MSSEPPPLIDGQNVCVTCGQPFPEADMVHIGDSRVCAACKPLFVQRITGGVAPSGRNFRDLSRLTEWLTGFLITDAVVAGLAFVFAFFARADLERSGGGFSEAFTPGDSIGLLQAGVYITTAVLFLRWTYFANSNARALGASGMRFTPGWSIGWHFIPIANLWKPYQAMKEIWKASTDPKNWQQVAASALLPAWWTLWIISNSLGQASFRASLRADKPAESIHAAVVILISDAMDIPLSLVALKLVRKIWGAQKRQGAERSERADDRGTG